MGSSQMKKFSDERPIYSLIPVNVAEDDSKIFVYFFQNRVKGITLRLLVFEFDSTISAAKEKENSKPEVNDEIQEQINEKTNSIDPKSEIEQPIDDRKLRKKSDFVTNDLESSKTESNVKIDVKQAAKIQKDS